MPHAPHELSFPLMSTDFILAVITDGVMAQQAALLGEEERRALAEHLAGVKGSVTALPPTCSGKSAALDAGQAPAVDGWGFGLASTRVIPAHIAGLSAADVPRLKLKWAFAYPGASRARSQPMVAAGAVHVGGQNGGVYALDLGTVPPST
jgi:polyvinyl alcohol dehydrogenase (cytochrome)